MLRISSRSRMSAASARTSFRTADRSRRRAAASRSAVRTASESLSSPARTISRAAAEASSRRTCSERATWITVAQNALRLQVDESSGVRSRRSTRRRRADLRRPRDPASSSSRAPPRARAGRPRPEADRTAPSRQRRRPRSRPRRQGHFPNEEAARKLIYLAIVNAVPAWTRQPQPHPGCFASWVGCLRSSLWKGQRTSIWSRLLFVRTPTIFVSTSKR